MWKIFTHKKKKMKVAAAVPSWEGMYASIVVINQIFSGCGAGAVTCSFTEFPTLKFHHCPHREVAQLH